MDLKPITRRLKIRQNLLYDRTVPKRKNTLDVLRNEEIGAFVSYNSLKELIKDITTVINLTFQIRQRKALTRETSNHNIRPIGNIRHFHPADITTNNMISNILFIRGNSVLVKIIRPNNFISCTNHSQVETSSATKQT